MEGLRLEIVTPDKIVLETTADYVGAPGVDGEFGVLPGHIPLLSALAIGSLYYKKDGFVHWAFISGGFAEVAENKIMILAEAAELAGDIDVDRAQQARERAEARLRMEREHIDVARAESALLRSIARIHTVNK